MIFRWCFDDLLPEMLAHPALPIAAAELLRAHRFGHHLVVLDRKVGQCLGGLGLSDADKALLSRLTTEYTQTGNLHEKSSVYVTISSDPDSEISLQNNNISVSFASIVSTELLRKPALVVEDQFSDGWTIIEMLRAVAKSRKFGPLCLEVVHGGGENIVKVVEQMRPFDRIALVVADSDKNCPTTPSSLKTLKLARLVQEENWPAVRFLPLICREIENLLPVEILMDIPSGKGCPDKSVYLRIFDAEVARKVNFCESYFRYADLKNGFDINSNKYSEEEKININGIFENLGLKINKLSGLGGNIIQQIRDDGRHISEFGKLLMRKSWIESHSSYFIDFLWHFASSRKLTT